MDGSPRIYKLHGICTMSGVFHSIDITKANVHDIAYLKDVKSQISDAVLLGDKGYISNEQQLDLFHTVNVRLETPMRSNRAATVRKNIESKHMFSEKQEKDRSAEAIETLFSQLCDQFMIRRNYAGHRMRKVLMDSEQEFLQKLLR